MTGDKNKNNDFIQKNFMETKGGFEVIINSCAENFSYNTCADFWHACAKGLETISWKHTVVKLI